MRVSQPVGQKRHTNIAIVSVRKKVEGKDYKFEIACYPNKVLNQREGLETDLAQVLQTETIFTNVSRGDIATHEDLVTVFGTTNNRKICEQIIKEGNLQVSDKEREYIQESRSRDILNLVVQMTMDAVTGYPLTVTQVQALLDDVHFRVSSKSSVRGSKATKQREEEEETKVIARDCVKKLETELPHRVCRVSMLLRLVAKSVTEAEILQLAEDKCFVQAEGEAFLITCHPRVYKIIKDALGDRVESLSVVDSYVHKIPPNSVPPPPPTIKAPEVLPAEPAKVSPKKATSTNVCVTCGDCEFDSLAEFRTHCKSGWHAYNKKRQVKCLPFVDHLEFEMMPEELRQSFNAVDP